MKMLVELLTRTLPFWLFILAFAGFAYWKWVVFVYWDGVTFLNWLTALSSIIGACIAVIGAYLIAVKQLKPVLTQRRTEQKQEWIDRQKECVETLVGLSRTCLEAGNKSSFLFEVPPEKGSHHLIKNSYQEYVEELQPRFTDVNYELQEALRSLNSFIVYEDTGQELREKRAQFSEFVNKIGWQIIAIENLVAKLANTKEPSALDVAPLPDAVASFFDVFEQIKDLHGDFVELMTEEQRRLERLITTKHEH
ncbi:hypothetical protein [Roseibium album]|uniref:hypothetical protein n=1 Tax=Roseibium album TaxID=311410 RepID=UPI002492C74E|nr:hypothetical protein [Roseibium album]